MRRREFIAGIAATAWPVTARAQTTQKRPLVGFLDSGSPGYRSEFLAAFRKGLADTGYVEGRNVTVEYRWAEFHYDRMPSIVAEFIRYPVAVIACPGNTPAPIAARAATQTIPIVFAIA